MKNGGGALWDIGPYAIHTLRHSFKENPVRVYAQSKLNEHGADISTTGMIDFGDNKKAHSILALNVQGDQNMRYLVHLVEQNALLFGSQRTYQPR